MQNAAICIVNLFTTGSPDKNGLMPVIIVPLSGTIPNKTQVFSGTAAKTLGFEIGKRYFVTYRRVEDHPIHGPQFKYTNGGEAGMFDTIQSTQILGGAGVYDVKAKDEVKVDENVIPPVKQED